MFANERDSVACNNCKREEKGNARTSSTRRTAVFIPDMLCIHRVISEPARGYFIQARSVIKHRSPHTVILVAQSSTLERKEFTTVIKTLHAAQVQPVRLSLVPLQVPAPHIFRSGVLIQAT